MKKYLVGLTAIVLAVVTFAFTARKKINFTDYVWYPVKTTVHIPCNVDLSTIQLTDLNIDTRYNNTGNFGLDISAETFASGSAELAFVFGCDTNTHDEMCAIGFLKPASGTSGFVVQDGKWVPSLASNVAQVRLCRVEP